MYFDTHCHLNFSAFKNNLNEVIDNAKSVGVDQIVIPGTDFESSKRAVEIAEQCEGIYAAVGIHPHHIYEIYQKARHRIYSSASPPKGGSPKRLTQKQVSSLLPLLKSKKVIAIGEVGLDRHIYKKTKYDNYQIDNEFIEMQKELLQLQIQLAIKYNKSLILHNRETKTEILELLRTVWDSKLEGKTVFHCCEPDFAKATSGKPDSLLEFAKKHNIFIGVDGDLTYDKRKEEFVKKIPLELLVLETDSPFLLPQLSGSRSWSRYNEPKNIKIIAEFITDLLNISINQLIDITTENAKRLFQI